MPGHGVQRVGDHAERPLAQDVDLECNPMSSAARIRRTGWRRSPRRSSAAAPPRAAARGSARSRTGAAPGGAGGRRWSWPAGSPWRTAPGGTGCSWHFGDLVSTVLMCSARWWGMGRAAADLALRHADGPGRLPQRPARAMVTKCGQHGRVVVAVLLVQVADHLALAAASRSPGRCPAGRSGADSGGARTRRGSAPADPRGWRPGRRR